MVVRVCTGIDRYQNKTYQDYPVAHVHMQNSNETRKTASNTEVLLRSIMFVDCRLSAPQLDYWQLKVAAEKAGGDMRLTYDGEDYRVETVDLIPDDLGKPHHFELGCV